MDNFDWVVDYLEDCIDNGEYHFRKGIYARNIISLEEDVNLKLYSEFLRLYKFGVEGKFYSVYSKVANKNLPQISATERVK